MVHSFVCNNLKIQNVPVMYFNRIYVLTEFTFRQIVQEETEHVMFLKLELFVITYLCGRNQCPNFYTGRIQLENNTLVSENAGFHKEINADHSHGWFWAHFQLVLDQYARFRGEMKTTFTESFQLKRA